MKISMITTALVLALAAPALAEGDVEKGEKVFKKCKACHAVGEDAKNRVGPILNNIFGEKAGQVEGFSFSKAMVEAGENGLVWDEASIDEYLAKPKDFIPGNKMSFAGLKKEQDRADVIAYIKTFSAE